MIRAVPLVWISGVSGSGKSTVCGILKGRGHVAVDADWEGYCRWVHRGSAEVLTDPPHVVPPGWLERFGWMIDVGRVQSLAAASAESVAFLGVHAENAADIAPHADRIVCLAIDEGTLRHRLQTRTSNDFGKNPDELAAAVARHHEIEAELDAMGAVTIDSTRPLDEVVRDVLAIAFPTSP